MPNFCAFLNCSNRRDREKDKSNNSFPSVVKNNSKKGLKHLKVRREKRLAQIFRKVLTERMLEWIKSMLSASPSLVFSHKADNIDLKSKYVFYPN